MAGKLSDRLREASHRLFVGRNVQCSLFAEAIEAKTLPFSIFHIYGPGGIGKTSLLYEFKRLAHESGVQAYYLDTRLIEADPVAFLHAIRQVLRVGESEKPEDALGASGRNVLMLDTFESMYALEQWLYSTFFPGLSDNVFIVIAGRFPPATTWTDNPGWRSLIQTSPLRNLAPDESRQYLSRTGMPEEHHQAVINYTHGHPLALSLVAESFNNAPGQSFDSELEPNFIKVLLDRFVRDVPSLSHRLALEACVLVNHLTESLLGQMIGEEKVRAVFDWLRRLSFIESGPRGLFPHDLAREVLGAELKWRNPDQFKTLHERARAFYNTQLSKASPEEQGNILKDYIFLHRDNAIVKPFFIQLQAQWQGGAAAVSTDRYREDDRSQIVEMVSKHQGDAAGVLAGKWIDEQPENVVVFRNPQGQTDGFLLLLALHDASSEMVDQDPVVATAMRFLRANAPLRSGEAATIFRFWMDRESYQNISQIQSLIFVYMVRHYLTTPNLAFSMVPISNPQFWKAVFNYADLDHLEDLDFEVNDIAYGIFGHDWRQRPPAAWLDVLASRETSKSFEPVAEPPRREMLVLSEEAFARATRDALKHYARPDKLKKNPLLSSRIVADLVAEDAGADERIEMLIKLLDEHIELLRNNVRAAKAYRAIDRTFLRPAGSQEAAAEVLDLPFSTYRRHLAKGLTEITEALWQKELGG